MAHLKADKLVDKKEKQWAAQMAPLLAARWDLHWVPRLEADWALKLVQ
jgi:hypothetical protein